MLLGLNQQHRWVVTFGRQGQGGVQTPEAAAHDDHRSGRAQTGYRWLGRTGRTGTGD